MDAVGDGVAPPWPDLVEEFRAELERCGYAPMVVANHIRLFSQVVRWLDESGATADGVGWLDGFVASRELRPRVPLIPLWSLLTNRKLLVATPNMTGGAVDRMIAEFGEYLRSQRGLGAGTIEGYVGTVRSFIASLVVDDRVVGRDRG